MDDTKSAGGIFDTSKQNVSLHINNILKNKELDEVSVVKEYLTTAEDGKDYPTLHYSLPYAVITIVVIKQHRCFSLKHKISFCLQLRKNNKVQGQLATDAFIE